MRSESAFPPTPGLSPPEGGGEKDGARFVAASSFVFVDARARWIAASPPERRSLELSGGGCKPVPEPSPLSPRLIAGFSNSASAGPIGCTSGRCAFDFGVFGDFFGESGFFAMSGIWDAKRDQKRAIPLPDLTKFAMKCARFHC